MTVSESTVREELEWNEHLYNNNKEKLSNDDTEPPDIVSAHNRIAGSAAGIGICHFVLGRPLEGKNRFAEAAEYYLSFDDAVTEYEDAVPGSRQAHRPTTYKELLHSGLISGEEELLHQATSRVLEMDDAEYLEEWGNFEFHHVLYYVKSLSHLLTDNPETARQYIQMLNDLDHGFENYKALHDCLHAVEEANKAEVVDGLSQLLEWHQDEYGTNPSTPTDFISVDATALLVLARRFGLNISPEDFDDSLREFLPLALFDS